MRVFFRKKSNEEIFDNITHPTILKKKTEILNSICGDISDHDIFLIESALRIINVINAEIDGFITRWKIGFIKDQLISQFS